MQMDRTHGARHHQQLSRVWELARRTSRHSSLVQGVREVLRVAVQAMKAWRRRRNAPTAHLSTKLAGLTATYVACRLVDSLVHLATRLLNLYMH